MADRYKVKRIYYPKRKGVGVFYNIYERSEERLHSYHEDQSEAEEECARLNAAQDDEHDG